MEKLIRKFLDMIKKDKDTYRQIEFPPHPSIISWKIGFIPIRTILLIIIVLIEIFSISFLSEKEIFRNSIMQILLMILMFWTIFHTIKNYKRLLERIQEGRNNSLEKNLQYMIYSLGLYTEEPIIMTNGKNQLEKKVTSSLSLFYREDELKIYIRVLKDGGKYTKTANNLEDNLQSAIGYRLESIYDDINFCEYIFKKKEDTRLILRNSTNIKLNSSDEIFLTEQLSFRLSKQPHVLIGGVTGGGKTTLINYLILELLKMQSTIFVLDNKNSDLASLRQYLGNDYVGSNSNESARITRLVSEELELRFKTYKEDPNKFIYGGNYLDYNLKPIVLIVDELGALRASADKKVFSEIISNLTNIVLKGREMGIFVVLSTQQPNSQNIPTELRDNLSVKISLGNLSDEGYRMCFNEVPEETIQNVGEGFVFIDGKCTKPQKIKFPFVDYKNFNFIDELKKIQNLINENERR